MAYDTDESREAARQRLQARMERHKAARTPHIPAGPTALASPSAPVAREGAPARRALKRLSPAAAAAAIAIVVLAAILAVALSQCSTGTVPGSQPEAAVAGQGPSDEVFDEAAARSQLTELIGEEEAGKLLVSAAQDENARWIAAHPDEYASEGPEVQEKILKLAANEPAAMEYVRNYPNRYPAKSPDAKASAMGAGSPSPDVPDTSVPHLYQWDMRWGYTVYSSAAFGLSGCGPTAMAMVAQTLAEPVVADEEDGADTPAGDGAITPCDMGDIARENGFMGEFTGTGSDFFTFMAGELGLYCESLYPTGDNLAEALANGAVVVANVGPGQFTENGHFLVLAGLADDGSVIVNDPYSVERSSRTWDADTIADESIALFAFTAA